MYHYGLASALGYALSMFSETLRDRKLVTLEQDLLILIIGFCFPMVRPALPPRPYPLSPALPLLEALSAAPCPRLASTAPLGPSLRYLRDVRSITLHA